MTTRLSISLYILMIFLDLPQTLSHQKPASNNKHHTVVWDANVNTGVGIANTEPTIRIPYGKD